MYLGREISVNRAAGRLVFVCVVEGHPPYGAIVAISQCGRKLLEEYNCNILSAP
jgi:hypothetical protein